MIRCLHLLGLFGVVLLLSSCSSDFTITLPTSGGTQATYRIVYTPTDGGTVSQWIASDKDQLRVKGHSSAPTLVCIYDDTQQIVARVVAQDGDEIVLQGQPPYNLTATGNAITEAWLAFVNAHARQYFAGNHQELDPAIEQYARLHPKAPEAALLLMLDHSQSGTPYMATLLKPFEDALPENFLATLQAYYAGLKPVTASPLPAVALSETGKLDTLKHSETPFTLLYLHSLTSADTASLGNYVTHGSKIRIYDVCLEPDTASWRASIQSKTVSWTRYIAPMGLNGAQLGFTLISNQGRILATGATLHTLRDPKGKSVSLQTLIPR